MCDTGDRVTVETENEGRPEVRSLRADLERLCIPIEESEHARGWNAALREAIKIADRHENDRQKKSARAIAHRKAQGKKTGGDVPYGYQLAADGETLRESPEEQAVIALAKKLRKNCSLREVAHRLRQAGKFPRERSKDPKKRPLDEFHAAQIWRMTDEKAK
jgi:hypothetical protein